MINNLSVESHAVNPSAIIASRLVSIFVNVALLATLAWLAGYNIIFQTTDSVIYEKYYDSIELVNGYEKVFDFTIALEGVALGELGFEPFFNLLATISKLQLKLNFNDFVSLLMFISLSIKFYIFSRHKHAVFSKFAYLLTLYFVFECLITRGAFAISLLFLAFEFRKYYWAACLFLILACLTHYSIIIFAPILIFYKVFENKERLYENLKYAFLLIVAFVIIVYVYLYSFGRFSHYIMDNPANLNIYGMPRYLLLWMMVGYYVTYKKNLTENACFLLFVGTFALMLSSITFYFSLFSIRVLDIGVLSFYLINNDNFKNRQVGNFIFGMYILEEFLIRTLPSIDMYEVQSLFSLLKQLI